MTDAAQSVLAAEDARARAMLARDETGVAALLSDKLTYVHGNGAIDTKESYLTRFRAGEYAYSSMARSNENLLASGDCVIVTGHRTVVVTPPSSASPITVESFATCVWVLEEGAWRLIVYQGTFTAPPS